MTIGNTRQWRHLRSRVLREEATCYICGKVVDKTLATPDPGSPEVDHVLPRDTHPHLAMARSNVHLAHRRCNRDKSNGPVPTMLVTSREW